MSTGWEFLHAVAGEFMSWGVHPRVGMDGEGEYDGCTLRQIAGEVIGAASHGIDSWSSPTRGGVMGHSFAW